MQKIYGNNSCTSQEHKCNNDDNHNEMDLTDTDSSDCSGISSSDSKESEISHHDTVAVNKKLTFRVRSTIVVRNERSRENGVLV